jgi:histone deacetylase 1/2
MLVLGGGGYTIRNVAKTWAYETGILVGEDLCEGSPFLPFNEYMEYFGPEFKMEVPANNMDNQNPREYLDHIRWVATQRIGLSDPVQGRP